jgi:acyl carrier protein
MTMESRLLGEVPELDSMAVISVITALEEQCGVMFDDDEIGADTFETVGSLIQLVQSKTNAA